jgi:ceramide glucosyltransferase
LIFWLFFLWTLLASLSTLGAALRVWHYFGHSRQISPPDTLPGCSVLLPLKGLDRHTRYNLETLLTSRYPGPLEFLLAMESDEDPAFALVQELSIARPLITPHSEREIRIVLSGDPGERMGKQHNLVAALAEARYDWIASMDADVLPSPQTLALGVQAARQPGVGVAFSMPYYFGEGLPGGHLVALYCNYFFFLYSGSLALLPNPAFTVGSFWFTSRAALAKIGGLEPFTAYVTDDAAIGRAVVAAGLTNLPLHTPVPINLEELNLAGGLRQLQKWIAMLRAEGLSTYLLVIGLWFPSCYGVLTLLAASLMAPEQLPLATAALSGAVLARLASVLLLNRSVYIRLPRMRYLLAVVGYELLVAPILFGLGFFWRTLVWRGRRYRIGRLGKLLGVEKL